jgi:hypothetical protein
MVFLFEDLIGPDEQRRRHFHAECLRGLEIDEQLDFRYLLNQQVAPSLERPGSSRNNWRGQRQLDLVGDHRHRLCARAASGHAVAIPPSSVMNSRLLIRSLHRRGLVISAAH